MAFAPKLPHSVWANNTVGQKKMPPRFTEVPEMSLWSQSIGGFIINFGIAEFLTLRCVEVCAGPKSAKRIRKKVLADRITAAKSAIESSRLSPPKKKRASELWSEISTLSKMRNRIAHNPLLAGRHATTGALVFSIVDLKKMEPLSENALEPLDYSEIAATALRVRAITRELSSLIESTPIGP